MATLAGVGMSHHRNPVKAAEDAVGQARNQSGIEGDPDFVFMFSSVGYKQQPLLKAVRKQTGEAPLSGCSGEGIISLGDADEGNFSLAVMLIKSDELRFVHGLSSGMSDSSSEVGSLIGNEVKKHKADDNLGMFVFADGLTLNFDQFVENLESHADLSSSIPLLGGTAADNWAMQKTFQFCDDQISSDGVSWALMSGDADLAVAVNHGCTPVGSERKVTRSEGNIIYEIDHKPVLEVLKEYLMEDEVDNWQKTVVNLCLGFKAPSHLEGYDEYLIRFMPAKDDETGSVQIPTEVEEGTSIWMTRRDHEKISQGIDRISQEIQQQLNGKSPKMVFQFDCAGRGKMVFRDNQKTQLLEKLQQQIDPDAPWIGFYTYGEIGPVNQNNCFHNYTAVLTAVY